MVCAGARKCGLWDILDKTVSMNVALRRFLPHCLADIEVLLIARKRPRCQRFSHPFLWRFRPVWCFPSPRIEIMDMFGGLIAQRRNSGGARSPRRSHISPGDNARTCRHLYLIVLQS